MLPRTPSVFDDPKIDGVRRAVPTGVEQLSDDDLLRLIPSRGADDSSDLRITPGHMSGEVGSGIRKKYIKLTKVIDQRSVQNPLITLVQNELDAIQMAKSLYDPALGALTSRENFLMREDVVHAIQACDNLLSTHVTPEYLDVLKYTRGHTQWLLQAHNADAMSGDD